MSTKLSDLEPLLYLLPIMRVSSPSPWRRVAIDRTVVESDETFVSPTPDGPDNRRTTGVRPLPLFYPEPFAETRGQVVGPGQGPSGVDLGSTRLGQDSGVSQVGSSTGTRWRRMGVSAMSTPG